MTLHLPPDDLPLIETFKLQALADLRAFDARSANAATQDQNPKGKAVENLALSPLSFEKVSGQMSGLADDRSQTRDEEHRGTGLADLLDQLVAANGPKPGLASGTTKDIGLILNSPLSLSDNSTAPDVPDSAPEFASFDDFLASGLAAFMTEVSISGTLYHLRDAEPLHQGFKHQDDADRWWSPDYFVVVAAGQSNMLGAGVGGDMTMNPNVVAYDWVNGQLVLADYDTAPAGGSVVRPGSTTKNNLYFPFANSVSEELGQPVLVIAHPVSGSNIDSWLLSDGGTNWVVLDADIEAALAAVGQTEVDDFLWHQGEANFATPIPTYQADVTALIDQIGASSWASPDLPILIGELSRASPNYVQNTALQALEQAGTDDFVQFVSSVGLTTTDKTGVHFDGNSLVEFGGERYMDALMAVIDPQYVPDNTAPVRTTGLAPQDRPPTSITMNEGETLVLDVAPWFTDPEDDDLWFYAYLSKRSVYLIGADTDEIILTPDFNSSGTYVLTIYANDYNLDGATITISLNVINAAPGINIYTGRDFSRILTTAATFDAALVGISAGRGVDILTQSALDPASDHLVTQDSLYIRGGAGLEGDFIMAANVTRTYLRGTAAFTVEGNAKANIIDGNDGTNTLWGLTGNDRLNGFDGADTLFGGADSDQLYGGGGNDVLNGMTGTDQAWGATGADTFVFGFGTKQLTVRDFAGADKIMIADFASIDDYDSFLATARIFQSGTRVIADIGSSRLIIDAMTVASLNEDMFMFS